MQARESRTRQRIRVGLLDGREELIEVLRDESGVYVASDERGIAGERVQEVDVGGRADDLVL